MRLLFSVCVAVGVILTTQITTCATIPITFGERVLFATSQAHLLRNSRTGSIDLATEQQKLKQSKGKIQNRLNNTFQVTFKHGKNRQGGFERRLAPLPITGN